MPRPSRERSAPAKGGLAASGLLTGTRRSGLTSGADDPLNPYTVIVLTALLLQHGLRMLSDLLNLRTQTPAPPPEFRDVFDPDRYRRSQAYMRARTRFATIASSAQLLILLLFWFGGGFGWIDRSTRALDFGSVVTGLAFIGALGLARLLVGLPL